MHNQPATINIGMTTANKTRIAAIDLLKGLVMVVMALDHVRDYFHYSAFMFDPSDPDKTSLPIFFTRFITHFCAPAFSFLAGLSAFMIGRRKSAAALSAFLFKRGLWLVLVEIVIVTFGWKFDVQFRHIGLQTIWQLGISMMLLAGLIHLPQRVLLGCSLLIIFGHNLLDNVHFDGSFLWAVLHEPKLFQWSGHYIRTAYPLLPWVAVMSLGYCFGTLYNPLVGAAKRRKTWNVLGIGSLMLFVVLILVNKYGDPQPWTNHGFTLKTLLSILDVTKYPPSLLYLLLTLGGTFLFLANTENWQGRMVNFLCVFGRVPFFYYILHIYLIHLIAVFVAWFTGFGWKALVLPTFITRVEALRGYGVNLVSVYLIWIGVILLLYPLCKKFDAYKQSHKEKWWLSYL